MYIPSSNAEHRPETMFDYMAAHPLAALVTSSSEGMIATHLPLLVDRTRGAHGTLAGHIARANPQQRQARDGKVVPTWNYVAVHDYGTLRFVSDPVALRRHLEALTSHHEAPRAQPWAVGDAPEEYIARQLRAIVGVEIEITRLEGKWKMSQNRAADDVDGVIAGLEASGDAAAREVADIVRARRPSI